MWWLAATRLSQVSSVLVAEVQTEATLMLGTTSGEKKKALSKFPAGQLFNPGQDVICYMPSAHKIWGSVNTVGTINAQSTQLNQCWLKNNTGAATNGYFQFKIVKKYQILWKIF